MVAVPKTKQILTTVTERDLFELDEVAEVLFLSRAEVIRRAVLDYIRKVPLPEGGRG